MARFIPDRGMVSGLFTLCTSNIKSTPLLFATPAWLLSLVDLNFSPVQIRILPFIVVLGCAGMAAYYAIKNINPFAALWMVAATIGVACAPLVFARHEFILFANLFFGLLALHILSNRHAHLMHRSLAAVALIVSTLTSLYVHPQGMIFLPLTAYLSYRLVAHGEFDLKTLCLWLVGSCFIAYTTYVFHAISCNEYPDLAKYIAEMVFQPTALNDTKLVDFITNKLSAYESAFTYNTTYTVNYLPNISVDEISATKIIPFLNKIISTIATTTIFLNMAICCVLGIAIAIQAIIKRKVIANLNTDIVIVHALIVLPVVFLFLYDAKQFFYRSAAIHFLLIIALVMILSNLHNRFLAQLTVWLGGLMCVICLLSVIANHIFFYNELKTYEGPGISVNRNFVQLQSNVQEIIKTCRINPEDGKAVIDDLIYDSVKQYGKVYPITYLGLQKDIAKVSTGDILKLLKPNYVLARCSSIETTEIGWPADVNVGELCCTRLNK